MLTKPKYSIKDLALWTRWETLFFLILAILVGISYHVFDFTFLHVPWTPVALIGTAVAFMVGFQNNAAYGRIWEARKIWGGIVNTSRTWGMKIKDMVTNEHSPDTTDLEISNHIKCFVHRHIAWMVALRHAMRQSKSWETFDQSHTNQEWANRIHIPERVTSLEDDLRLYLPEDEFNYIMSKNNKPAALLYMQSSNIRELKEKGLIWEFAFLDLENILQLLFDLQGKSERIKNFPYPRQYASLSYYFVWVFLLLLPFGIIPEFAEIAEKLSVKHPEISQYIAWLAIPFCGAVSWVFHTMERIGRVGENPFEGTANDVPISTIARGIEIDLRQLIDEDPDQIPGQFPEKQNVQM